MHINDDVTIKNDDTEIEVITKSVKLIDSYYSYFKHNINSYQNDTRFIHLDQWSADLRSARSVKRKQVLTVNYLYSYCQQVIGEEVRNDPDIKVRPTSDSLTASSEHANILEGLIRTIFIKNKFVEKKINAFKNAVFGGFGVLWVSYDYETPYSFNKKVIINSITDPTLAFFDPMASNSTKSDGNYCGYFSTITKSEFHSLYPDSKSDLSFKSASYIRDDKSRWGDKKTVRIADIWVKERYSEKIVLLSNGESMREKEALEMIEKQKPLLKKLKTAVSQGAQIDPELLKPIEICDTRISDDCYKIIHYKMIADEILEYDEWPSQHLPGIFVDHDSFISNGEQYTKSFHHNAQDMQKYLNYLASQSADALMNLHHGTWLANPEQLDGELMDMWLSPQNDKGILMANKDSDGAMPQFTPPPQISPAFDSQYFRTVKDIQNILGRFDAGRGQEDNAISGVAINSRAAFGNLGSIIPFQNLEDAVLQVAIVTASLIPAVYDTSRVIGIVGSNNEESKVHINNNTPNGIVNDMSQKEYDVTIQSTISFAAQRAQSISQFNQIMHTNPELSPVLSDLIASNLDLPNGAKIIERIRKYLTGTPVPQIISQETGTELPPPSNVPNPQAELIKKEIEIKEAELKLKEMSIMYDHKNLNFSNKIKEMQLQNEHAKIANDAVKNEISSQELINNAVSSHQKTEASIQESHSKMVDARIRAAAEIEKESIAVRNKFD